MVGQAGTPNAPWRRRPALACRGHLARATKEQGQDGLATEEQGQDALATMEVYYGDVVSGGADDDVESGGGSG